MSARVIGCVCACVCDEREREREGKERERERASGRSLCMCIAPALDSCERRRRGVVSWLCLCVRLLGWVR